MHPYASGWGLRGRHTNKLNHCVELRTVTIRLSHVENDHEVTAYSRRKTLVARVICSFTLRVRKGILDLRATDEFCSILYWDTIPYHGRQGSSYTGRRRAFFLLFFF